MEQIGQCVRFCGVQRETWLIIAHPMGQCLNGHAESLGPESHIDQECPLSIHVDNTELQLFPLLSQCIYTERCFLFLQTNLQRWISKCPSYRKILVRIFSFIDTLWTPKIPPFPSNEPFLFLNNCLWYDDVTKSNISAVINADKILIN